jgi:hypothetical protein
MTTTETAPTGHTVAEVDMRKLAATVRKHLRLGQNAAYKNDFGAAFSEFETAQAALSDLKTLFAPDLALLERTPSRVRRPAPVPDTPRPSTAAAIARVAAARSRS